MTDYQDIFMRVEKKYLLSEEKYTQLLFKLQEYTILDTYGKSTISNIYFDTPDHRLIRASLEKPMYKEKLRLRSYGVPDGGGMVFPEVKKKYDGIVYKRRVAMTLTEAEEYLYRGRSAPKPCQITREIDWMCHYYERLLPAMAISYERLALRGIGDPGLRITFDRNILWRETELSLADGIFGNVLLGEGQRLMELKLAGVMPLWLAHFLDQLEIRPATFSKYGNAYLVSQRLQTQSPVAASAVPAESGSVRRTAKTSRKGVEICA